jgi:hypothetical protein
MAAPCGFSIGTEKLYDGQDFPSKEPSLMNLSRF